MGPPASTELSERIEDLTKEGISRFIIELTQVTWMNSLGLGAIMKCLKIVDAVKGHIYLVGLTDKVRSVFVMSQLTKILTIREDLETAITQLNEV